MALTLILNGKNNAQPTTKVFAKAGLDIGAIGYVQASAAVWADIYQFGF